MCIVGFHVLCAAAVQLHNLRAAVSRQVDFSVCLHAFKAVCTMYARHMYAASDGVKQQHFAPLVCCDTALS
jgi:hypothetical protein